MKVFIGSCPNERFYSYLLYKLFNYVPKRIEYVKIDKCDTWSMDSTLAKIIHPMLIQLHDKGTPHSRAVEQEDAPHITFFEGDYSEEAWSYVLGEMIWAFEQKADDKVMVPYMKPGDVKRMKNGLLMFGKYYENLWD
jgi:hypothetical protein